MTCIFCSAEHPPIGPSILKHYDNFWLVYDGFPISEPHLLIIPKQHTASYSDLQKDLWNEYDEIVREIHDVLGNTDLLMFEHGKIGQSVQHAHMHVVQTTLHIDDIVSKLPQHESQQITSQQELTNFNEYLYIGSGSTNDHRVLDPTSHDIEPAAVTNTIAEILEMPVPAANRSHPPSETVQYYKSLFQ